MAANVLIIKLLSALLFRVVWKDGDATRNDPEGITLLALANKWKPQPAPINLLILRMLRFIITVMTGRPEALLILAEADKFLDKPPTYTCECGRTIEATDWE